MTEKPTRKEQIKNTDTSFESFLEEEGILEEVDEAAVKRVQTFLAKPVRGSIDREAQAKGIIERHGKAVAYLKDH